MVRQVEKELQRLIANDLKSINKKMMKNVFEIDLKKLNYGIQK